jgi:DNA polymerase-1
MFVMTDKFDTGDYLPTGVPKWTAKDVKLYAQTFNIKVLNVLSETNYDKSIAKKAMQLLAEHKAEMWNRAYNDKLQTAFQNTVPEFNPASPDQKHELFTGMLGFESEKFTDAWEKWLKEVAIAERRNYSIDYTQEPKNKYSWDRDNIETIMYSTDDEDIKEMCQAMIDFSFGAIVRNNFINAFYNYSVDSVLYGNLNLFGAKSFRLTSNSPNMLNMPSTGSIYAKPLKKCLVAPPGYVIYTIDYSALEDRVIASLAKDKNKCNIFLEGLDGHCLNAYGYFKEQVAQHMELTGDTTTDVKNFFELQENGNKELKDIRQAGKPATFGLAYGAFPAKVSRTLKIPLEEAQSIFDRYHNELYAGITDYRENYVLPTAKKEKRIHLGLGCYLYTDNAEADIRTLNNATIQFWSILTLLTINKLHQKIDEANLQDSIFCIATIYDSIYFIVREDADVLRWLNDEIVTLMTKDFVKNQIVKNEATGEIGRNWAELKQIKNNATVEEISEVLKDL